MTKRVENKQELVKELAKKRKYYFVLVAVLYVVM